MTMLLPPNTAAEPSLTALPKPLLFKALAITAAVLVLHSVFLWWSLSPSNQANKNADSLAQLRLQRGAELPEQPQGDLFVIGRERLDDDAARAAAENAEPKDPGAVAGDYQLLAVMTKGKHYYAVFDNGIAQQKLKVGEVLPEVGEITRIDSRQVRVNNPELKEGEQQFSLFPVIQPKSKDEENTETTL